MLWHLPVPGTIQPEAKGKRKSAGSVTAANALANGLRQEVGAAREIPSRHQYGCRAQRLTDQSKVQSVRCRLSPTADVPSHTSGAAMCQKATSKIQCYGNAPSSTQLTQLRRGIATPLLTIC